VQHWARSSRAGRRRLGGSDARRAGAPSGQGRELPHLGPERTESGLRERTREPSINPGGSGGGRRLAPAASERVFHVGDREAAIFTGRELGHVRDLGAGRLHIRRRWGVAPQPSERRRPCLGSFRQTPLLLHPRSTWRIAATVGGY